MSRLQLTVPEALETIGQEYAAARARHAPMRGAHEGNAVILEELDELWELVRQDRGARPEAILEAMQIAAMALAYMVEVAE